MAGPCKNCGDQIAPFGFRRPGFFTQLPPEKRTYVFVCAQDACQQRAKDWVRRAENKPVFSRKASSPPSTPQAASDTPDLFSQKD